MDKELKDLIAKYWKDFANIIPNNTPLFWKLSSSIFRDCATSSQFHDYLSKLNDVPAHLKLALTMSASLIDPPKPIDVDDAKRIVEVASDFYSKSQSDSQSIAKTIESSPNLCALLGAQLTVQILSTISIETLSKTPSSNLANKIPLLEESDLIRNFSPNEKQAIRQFSSKIVLCSRLDLQKSPNNELAKKWRLEIEDRLNKFKEAPEVKAIRPLPIPLEKKSKKRGGRRLRKMKERLEMSQADKLQNRMMFGERETTKIVGDEEIGLGLLDRKKVQSGPTTIKNNNIVKSIKDEKPTQDYESDLLQFL